MARQTVPNDRPVKIADMKGKTGKGIVVRAVTGGVTFFLATGSPMELTNVEAGGVPLGGIPLELTSAPQIFNFFADELWCRATAEGDIDTQEFVNG